MTLRPRDWYESIIALAQKIVRDIKTKHHFMQEKSRKARTIKNR